MRLADPELWDVYEQRIGTVYWRANLGTTPIDVECQEVVDWALAQRGHWAAVVVNTAGTFAVTDNLRSFPILYSNDADPLVSSTAEPLLDAMRGPRLDRAAAAEFVHAGYLFGPQTLIAGISSARASAVTDISTGRVVAEYRMATSYTEADADPDEYLEYFYRVILKAFEPIVASGRQLLVPLSGGADSRLIMMVLRELGASNVLAFTYGTAGSTEVRVSREVARSAGYEWRGITLEPGVVRERWLRPETGDFLRYAWSGEALPHIQDWYALGDLHGETESGAIVLAGHTIVGNEHDDERLAGAAISVDDAVRLVAAHHFHLRGATSLADLPDPLVARLRDHLEKTWIPNDPAHNAKVLVDINSLTRQPRYINNSMRGYEHFGFNWALPMLNADVWDAWLSGPRALHTGKREHYVRFVNEGFARAFDADLQYFAPRVGQIEPERKKRIKAVLSAVRLLDPLTNLARIRTERHHPMAFEALAGTLSLEQFTRRLLRGQSTLGVYCDLFLANEWVPDQKVVPEP
ncbi:asparagine synthase (glutamine-hydrolyzing) [Trueperella bonasi]|uniref:asparagine synthase (glutamine-hydrolyzing) n=1 Tax=Trueperella bonasi TaxID=312286 RepID=A0ABT9NFN0_9ACTO|nr:asparagine synthase-related protein [Trueperella bonasi]MDP9806010.1 asparagine synthase (glutamine-hydrolyzing) [Trueperella bonasi]